MRCWETVSFRLGSVLFQKIVSLLPQQQRLLASNRKPEWASGHFCPSLQPAPLRGARERTEFAARLSSAYDAVAWIRIAEGKAWRSTAKFRRPWSSALMR